MKFHYAVLAVMFLAAASLLAQQAPPLTNQSTPPASTHKQTRSEKSKTSAAHGGVVDLNTASKEDIAALPGIGADYAQTIIDARPFKSKQDLLRKRIIPEATYNKIKSRVTAAGPKKQSVTPGQR
jgi:competence protein ComEA